MGTTLWQTLLVLGFSDLRISKDRQFKVKQSLLKRFRVIQIFTLSFLLKTKTRYAISLTCFTLRPTSCHRAYTLTLQQAFQSNSNAPQSLPGSSGNRLATRPLDRPQPKASTTFEVPAGSARGNFLVIDPALLTSVTHSNSFTGNVFLGQNSIDLDASKGKLLSHIVCVCLTRIQLFCQNSFNEDPRMKSDRLCWTDKGA